MADRAAVEVRGIPALKRKLAKLDGTARDLSRVNRAVASYIVPIVRAGTKRRSGALRSAWKGKGTRRAAVVVNDLEYAGVQEFGWPSRHIDAADAVEHAIDVGTQPILDAYGDEMRKQIAAIGGGP